MMKKHILLLLIIILFFLNFQKKTKKTEKFTEFFPTVIWRQIYHLKYYESNINKFINNKNKIIHISNHNFLELFENINKINFDFKIISDYDDLCVPYDIRKKDFTLEKFYKVYDSSFLKEWWSVNYNYNHKLDKMRFLPLGINFHTLKNQKMWGENKQDYVTQENKLKNIYNSSLKKKRKLMCFMCNSLNSSQNLKKVGYIKMDRNDIINSLKENKMVESCDKDLNRTALWEKITEYYFVICPAGNGFDTHRLWEVLYLGGIPIVQKTGLDKFMSTFPVVIVDNFEEINKKNLEDWYSKYKSMLHNPKVRKQYESKYWIDKINKF